MAAVGVRFRMTIEFDWWLTSLGRTVIWAGVRELPAGTAEIVDSDGNLMAYDSLDTARAALMDADYSAFNGMDDDDAFERGFHLEELKVPVGTDVETLHPQLVQKLGLRQQS